MRGSAAKTSRILRPVSNGSTARGNATGLSRFATLLLLALVSHIILLLLCMYRHFYDYHCLLPFFARSCALWGHALTN